VTGRFGENPRVQVRIQTPAPEEVVGIRALLAVPSSAAGARGPGAWNALHLWSHGGPVIPCCLRNAANCSGLNVTKGCHHAEMTRKRSPFGMNS
jgi:hypothetical protein